MLIVIKYINLASSQCDKWYDFIRQDNLINSSVSKMVHWGRTKGARLGYTQICHMYGRDLTFL